MAAGAYFHAVLEHWRQACLLPWLCEDFSAFAYTADASQHSAAAPEATMWPFGSHGARRRMPFCCPPVLFPWQVVAADIHVYIPGAVLGLQAKTYQERNGDMHRDMDIIYTALS